MNFFLIFKSNNFGASFMKLFKISATQGGNKMAKLQTGDKKNNLSKKSSRISKKEALRSLARSPNWK